MHNSELRRLQVIGPLLYFTDDAPLYRSGLIANLIMFALVGVLALLIPLYLVLLNKRHAKQREQVGKSAAIVDESMIGKDKIRTGKEMEVEDAEGQEAAATTGGAGRTVEEDKGLNDVTDLKNEDFVYVY